LPSVRKKVLGKEPFADEIFAKCSLPSVTLGKGFAECKIAFAECLRHSAKNAILVVSVLRPNKPSHIVFRESNVKPEGVPLLHHGPKGVPPPHHGPKRNLL
jgi:hypothetical protein